MFLFLVLLLLPTLATAATYTATPSTLRAQLAHLGPGDTLQLAPGTYGHIQSDQLPIPSGTSWADAPRMVGGPGVVVRGISLRHVRYVIWSHLTIDCAWQVREGVYIGTGAQHIRVQDSEIKHCTAHGVLVPPESGGYNEFLRLNVHHNGTREHFDHGLYIAAAHNLIAHSQVHHNRGYGIHIYSRHATTAHHNVARDNHVYSNGRFGIILSNGAHSQAIGNRIHGNAWGAIAVDDSAPCAVLRENQTEGRIARRDRPQQDCPDVPEGPDLGLPALPVGPHLPPLPRPRNLRVLRL